MSVLTPNGANNGANPGAARRENGDEFEAQRKSDAPEVRHCAPQALPSAEISSGGDAVTKNSNLSAAKKAKNDEFYTQWADIEREMNAYLEYDPDVFRGKTVLLPCDDPDWSNFTKFFALHFRDFGIKQLISTSFAPNRKAGLKPHRPTLFEQGSPAYDKQKSMERGRMFVLNDSDVSAEGVVNIDSLQWCYLRGDGDFRSEEVTALRDKADIVITNPPFSLFRQFVAWLIEGGLQFSVIGNANAPTYKEIFPLIKNNELWKGATANNTDMVFGVPKGTDIAEADRAKAERLGYPADESYDYTRLGNSCWFTNIDHGRRHEPLQLMTMADNIKYSRHADVKSSEYAKYDNFDAIEVPHTDAIPSDYAEVMGVPITFLDKYNPDQFEIVGIAKTWFGGATKTYPQQIQVSASGQRTKVSKLNDGATIKVGGPIVGKTYYEVDGALFIQTYARVLIRKKAGA